MNPTKYYIRINSADVPPAAFEAYLNEQAIAYCILSSDSVSGVATHLYAIDMTPEQELVTRLKFKLKGCLNFAKTLGRLVTPLNNQDRTQND